MSTVKYYSWVKLVYQLSKLGYSYPDDGGDEGEWKGQGHSGRVGPTQVGRTRPGRRLRRCHH